VSASFPTVVNGAYGRVRPAAASEKVNWRWDMYERFMLKLGQAMLFDLNDLKRQEGQGVTEYGLVLAFVAIALGAILVTLKGQISAFITKVGTDLQALPGF
jgi:Flp pilus assembly pilin Flp